MSCQHESLNSDGVCNYCNEMVNQYMLKTRISNTGNKSAVNGIMKDLEALEITDDVKIAANDVFFSLNQGTRRGETRKRLVFFCLSTAYERLSDKYEKKDPKEIARLIGLNPTKINKAYKEYASLLLNKGFDQAEYTPLQYIKTFCDRLKVKLTVDLNIDTVFEMCQRIYDKSLNLKVNLNESPQIVAIAFIYYYMHIYGIIYDKKKFSETVDYSIASINSKVKLIGCIDNTSQNNINR